jgi:hypothetical protein
MNKLYDFNKAERTINNLKPLGLKQAVLGIEEDWHFTADIIWTKEEEFHENFKSKSILSINGSDWGTPTLRLIFVGNIMQDLPCFMEEDNA